MSPEPRSTEAKAAFVATNSICQGYSVSALWPFVLKSDLEIGFAHRSFKWKNNASDNAAVICVIICMQRKSSNTKIIYEDATAKSVKNINSYIIGGPDVYIDGCRESVSDLPLMDYGNKPVEGGHLILSSEEVRGYASQSNAMKFIRPFRGSQEVTKGLLRYCLWISDEDLKEACDIGWIASRVAQVREVRLKSTDRYVVEKLANRPHRFKQIFTSKKHVIIIPRHTSENREYLPADIFTHKTICSDAAMAMYDAPMWSFSIFSSRLHLSWIATVCGKLKTDFRYSNTLGWNTFPVPTLTEQNKADLTACAEAILLAREAHFPATIADLYDPETMPENLRAAHAANDEVLERIYIGRRFRNDTERLEKLFEMYTRMTKGKAA